MGKVEELDQRIREISLGISRVPLETKKGFIELANAEFSGDYGMCLKFCFEQAMEYQDMKITFFENINMKLNNILEKISQFEQKEKKDEVETIGTLSGRRIDLKGGLKKNE